VRNLSGDALHDHGTITRNTTTPNDQLP